MIGDLGLGAQADCVGHEVSISVFRDMRQADRSA